MWADTFERGFADLDSLWCLKLGLLAFYSRFIDVFRWGKPVTDALWWFIIATFIAVFITILAECRPLSLYVLLQYCSQALLTR
jgi:hypothetical protein